MTDSNQQVEPIPDQVLRGVHIFKEFVERSEQNLIVDDLRKIALNVPFFTPCTPWGKPMSVKMTSAGKFGWYADQSGYRYTTKHPNGQTWPEIPKSVLEIWKKLLPNSPLPESCLINFYQGNSKMGLHQDKDETDFRHPVLSVSLGDSALFRVGNVERGGNTESVWLESGDVAILKGDARLVYHGIDRIKLGSNDLLPKSGRINLTLRIVT